MYIWVSSDAPPQLISKIFGVDHFEAIPEDMVTTCVPSLSSTDRFPGRVCVARQM